MWRVIAHLDVDCFFVQAELLDRPELSGKPVVVYQHEDILSVSYEAQGLGIKRHDVTSDIRNKYPDISLISVPVEEGTTKVSYQKYISLSQQIFKIIRAHTASPIEKSGMDEAYFDLSEEIIQTELSNDIHQNIYSLEENHNIILTEWEKRLISSGKLCEEIRNSIKKKTGITVSIGIGSNKLIARVVSNLFKPDCQTVVLPRYHSKLLCNYSVRKIPGYHRMCKNIRNALENAKIETVNDVLQKESELESLLKEESFLWLLEMCRGNDTSSVVQSLPAKSVSVSMTLTPISQKNILAVVKIIEYLTSSLKTRLQNDKEEHKRRPTCLCIRFRHVGQKECKGENVSVPDFDNEEKWEQLNDSLLEHLILASKAYIPWKLRWCGIFCTKFQPVASSVVQYFSSQPKEKVPTLSNSSKYRPTPPATVLSPIKKKFNRKAKTSEKSQPSLHSFFAKK